MCWAENKFVLPFARAAGQLTLLTPDDIYVHHETQEGKLNVRDLGEIFNPALNASPFHVVLAFIRVHQSASNYRDVLELRATVF